MELLTQAQEMTEGQDDYLLRMHVQPSPDFLQDGLSNRNKKQVVNYHRHMFTETQNACINIHPPPGTFPPNCQLAFSGQMSV